MWSIYKTDKQMLTNRRCNIKSNGQNFDISKCFKLKDIESFGQLGEGSFGTVYSATATIKSKKVDLAVKITKDVYDTLQDKVYILDKNDKEIKIGILNSKYEIGPTIYDAFFIDLKSDVKTHVNGTIIQVVVMERMQYDCETALLTLDLTDNQARSIVHQMCDLASKQIKNYIFCVDVKPGNYMVNVTDPVPIVKMIDFGEFCSLSHTEYSRHNTKMKKFDPFTFLMMTLLQIFMHVVAVTVLGNKPEYYRFFFELSYFKKFFVDDKDKNKEFIINSLENGRQNTNKKDKQLWHYAKEFYLNSIRKLMEEIAIEEFKAKKKTTKRIKINESALEEELQEVIEVMTVKDVYDYIYTFLDP